MLQFDNLAGLLAQWASQSGRVLYRQYVDRQWRDYAAGELIGLAARWQAAYRASGLQAGDRVALCMKNGVDWVMADIAAHGLGLVVVPLYVDDNADNQVWCLQDSGAKLLVCDHLRYLPQLRQVLADLPKIVLTRGEAVSPAIPLTDWLPSTDAELSVRAGAADQLATIVYTSGTVGRPKGVMLSHANILADVAAIVKTYDIHDDDSLLSVLPLSHMFERTAGYYLPLFAGARVAYCRSIGELANDLAEQQPSVIIAVPRLFERMLARIEERLSATPFQHWLFHSAARAGWRRFNNSPRFYDGLILKLIYPRVAAPLRQRLGGRLRHAVVGGAALEHRVAEVFIGLGVPLLQGYGLTEASPVVAVNRQDNHDPASVGEPLPGIETRLSEYDELLVKGPTVMLGYWNNPEATAEAISADGWLNTGDVVELRERRIYIHGRSKNILVLSNGEKISPEDIELALMEDPMFEQVMVVGEGRPFLLLLAVSKEPDARVLLRHANQMTRHLPRYARIRRVIRVEEPWTVENGLMTPTLKVRRKALYSSYEREIDAAYSGRAS